MENSSKRDLSWKLIAVLGIAAFCFTFWLCFHKVEKDEYEVKTVSHEGRFRVYRVNTKTGETTYVWPKP